MRLNIKINQTININNLLFCSLVLISWGLVVGPVVGEFFFNLSIILGYIYCNKNKIKLNKKYIIILFIYWSYLILSNLYHYYFSDVTPKVITSFAYIRYIMFFLFIREIFFRLNYKKIIFYQGLPVLIIAFDVIFQKILGFNVIGMTPSAGRFSSFFGDEFISGSFISKLFFPFLIVTSYYYYKKKFVFEILILLFLISCFFSGERMAFISVFLTIPLSIILYKNQQKTLLLFLIITICIAPFVTKNTRFDEIKNVITQKEDKKTYFQNFKSNIYAILDKSGHLPLFVTSKEIWKDHLLIGSGINTFGVYCSYDKYKTPEKFKYGTCSTHPHNYYMEILNETGVIGFVLIFFFIIFVIIDAIKKIYLINNDNYLTKSYLISILIFLIVLSSGSFFNNFISIIFFLNLTLLSSLSSNNFTDK